MIKNIIFDLGNVLIDFKPNKFMERFTNNEDHINLFSKRVFWSETWLDLDRGLLCWKEAKKIFQTHHPEDKELLDILFNNWRDLLTPIEENIQILKELKDNGYKIYVLSNYIDEPFEYTKNHCDFFSLLDGQVISFKEKIIKPEKKIYQILIERYNLEPEECIFLDDHEIFLKPAKELGMHVIHVQFDTNIRAELCNFEVQIKLS